MLSGTLGLDRLVASESRAVQRLHCNPNERGEVWDKAVGFSQTWLECCLCFEFQLCIIYPTAVVFDPGHCVDPAQFNKSKPHVVEILHITNSRVLTSKPT